MIAFLLWYLVVLLTGWLAFPLAYRLLPGLPDRGYSLARALGLLVWGYVFWLLASLGILQNNIGGILFALVILAGLSVWAGWQDRFAGLRAWVSGHKGTILAGEIVFLAAFAAWAYVRSANPDISGTEKPMEMAFINAILHSPTFPPHDPWLSGYAISYYYFGYVMVAMLVQVTGVASPVGFNLAIALWFGLTALGAYGLVYNLLVHKFFKPGEKLSINLYTLPVLGPVFILIVSNFEGILDVLHGQGLFWSTAADGKTTSAFWQWLNILELNTPPPPVNMSLPWYLRWIPTRPGGTLWWRASRVLSDYTFNGDWREIIDEFPFFSYLLGDLHPHVLAVPFVLLVVGLILNFYFSGKTDEIQIGPLRIPLALENFLLAAVALGGLSFLNTWDFPIYVALFSAVYVLMQYRQHGWGWARLGDFIGLGFILGVAGGLLYLPFYLGFQSQANGFLPSLIFYTRGVNFWIMFGPLLIPIILFVFLWWWKQAQKPSLAKTIAWTGILLAGLLVASFLFAIAISFLPNLGSLFIQNQGASTAGMGALLTAALVERLKSPGTWLTLGILFVFVWALLKGRGESLTSPLDGDQSLPPETHLRPDSHGFILVLVLLGIFLTLVPEYFYLLDQFGYRINTIFKLYYQAWVVWGLAAAYASAVLLTELQARRRLVFQVGLTVLFIATFTYPVFGLLDKTASFKPSTGLTLDGMAFLERYNPDDAAAILWLQRQPLGVVTEAVGGSYTGYARVSVFSGMPTVLGWPGHVSQWRGGSREIGNRQADIETLYRTTDWQAALTILREYDIKYIYLGDMERSTYHLTAASETKLQRYMKLVYQQGSVTIYEVPDQLETSVNAPGLGQQ
jgi:YYY domain-containing protein